MLVFFHLILVSWVSLLVRLQNDYFDDGSYAHNSVRGYDIIATTCATSSDAEHCVACAARRCPGRYCIDATIFFPALPSLCL